MSVPCMFLSYVMYIYCTFLPLVMSVPCTFLSHVMSIPCTFLSLVMSVLCIFLYSQVEFQLEECTGQNIDYLPTGMYRTEHYLPAKRNVQERTLLICSKECTGQKGKFQLGNRWTHRRTDRHSDIWTSRAASLQLKIL